MRRPIYDNHSQPAPLVQINLKWGWPGEDFPPASNCHRTPPITAYYYIPSTIVTGSHCTLSSS